MTDVRGIGAWRVPSSARSTRIAHNTRMQIERRTVIHLVFVNERMVKTPRGGELHLSKLDAAPERHPIGAGLPFGVVR